MSTKVSVLKYMSMFANDAIEGKGITDLINGGKIVDNEKYKENYLKYNAMMSGYFVSGNEYHDKILYKKYISDMSKIDKTPSNFIDIINLTNETEVSKALYSRTSKKTDFYKKALIFFEMGVVSRSIVNELSTDERQEFERAIYDMAYTYDEAFNKNVLNVKIPSNQKASSKVKTLVKATV